MQRDDVGSREELRQFHVGRAEPAHLIVGEGVVGQQLTSEAGHDAGEDGADAAGPDHADTTAVEVEPEQPVEREVALSHPVVRAVGAPVEAEDERDRVLGDREG